MDGSDKIGQAGQASIVDAAVGLAPVPMIVVDRFGRLLSANQQWCQLYSAVAPATESDGLFRGVDPITRRRLLDEMERTADTGHTARVEVLMQQPAGSRWARWWLQRKELEGTVVLVIAVIDVHDEVAQRDDLYNLATHDDLTGLVNRRFFLQAVEQAVRRIERFPEPVCVLYIDLDGFKAVNDRAGHRVGDDVLTSMAFRLRQSVRGADVVGRIGGDEFAVLLERLASADDARVVASRIQQTLNRSVEVAGEMWPLSASVGLAVTRDPHESPTELLARADSDMYLMKRSHAATPAAPEASVQEQPPERAEPVAPHPPEPDSPPKAAVPTAGDSEGDTRTGESGPLPPDVRTLRDGMDTLKTSLEALLRDLEEPPDRPAD